MAFIKAIYAYSRKTRKLRQASGVGGNPYQTQLNSISHMQLVKICIHPFQTFCNMWAGVISMYKNVCFNGLCGCAHTHVFAGTCMFV